MGNIHTLDAGAPRAEALLVHDGKIACVGSRKDCEGKAEPGVERLDLKGGSAIPGLVDAHGHVLRYGKSLSEVSCNGLSSAEACAERVAARARTLPPGTWIHGRGWDQNLWSDARFPSATLLTRYAPEHPVALTRVDGHAVWVNERALTVAGIGAATPDPPGGRIERFPDGTVLGVLVDGATELVEKHIPAPTQAEIEALLERALQRLASYGLSAVHDAGASGAELQAYRALERRGRLPIRVYAMLDGQAPLEQLRAQMTEWDPARRGAKSNGWFEARAVKFYADGALGSRGARLSVPYADQPNTRGLWVTEPGELRERILMAAKAGFQPCVHAIGDEASRVVLEDFLQIDPKLRPRVEHLQLLKAEDAPLLARAGAIASMQPTHATSDGPWVEARIGRETPLQRGAYAWQQALAVHAPLACGSDFPVEDPDPRAGLYSAETRRWQGRNAPSADGWMPEQRLSRLEALRCFTTGAAQAAFAETRRGVLRVGYDADLTLFAEDIMTVPAESLKTLRVLGTWVGGRAVYRTQ